VDPNAVEGLVSSAAQAAVQAALTPTPEQQEQMRVNQEIEQIRQEYPDAMRKADAAEEFLAETLRSFVAQGYRFQSYEQIRNLMIERGVDQQLAQHIPELGGPMFVEFMDSLNSNNPTWRRSVASRMEAPPVANSALEGLPPAAPSMSPPALARRGGSRTGDVPQADRAEFEQLEVEFRKDITLMPQEKYDRMRELGAKLGVEGY
jgi:hypothetical protein